MDTPNDFDFVPHAIDLLRSKAGLTQTQIAAELGYSQSSLSRRSRQGRHRSTARLVDGLRFLLSKYGLNK